MYLSILSSLLLVSHPRLVFSELPLSLILLNHVFCFNCLISCTFSPLLPAVSFSFNFLLSLSVIFMFSFHLSSLLRSSLSIVLSLPPSNPSPPSLGQTADCSFVCLLLFPSAQNLTLPPFCSSRPSPCLHAHTHTTAKASSSLLSHPCVQRMSPPAVAPVRPPADHQAVQQHRH